MSNNLPVPEVSVIIPVYEDPLGLDATLRSLCRQTYSPSKFEIVVVDNGSREMPRMPGTLPVLTHFVRCEKPGSYAARNFGAAIARGAVFAFIDADCIADPAWLESGASEALRRNGPVGGDVRLFCESSRPNLVERYQLITGFYQKENIERQRFSVTANLFVPRRIFESVGGFDESLFSGGDWEWGWRAYANGFPVAFAPDAVVKHPCRKTLGSAIRQVRRVSGGRYLLRRRRPRNISPFLLNPHHGPRMAARTLGHSAASIPELCQLVALGALLWCTKQAEQLRLFMGGQPIR